MIGQMTKRTWARYIRVSRLGSRAGESFVSPDIQRRGINALIKHSEGKPGPEFTDIDRTGTDFNREGVTAAIAWVLEKPTERGLATYDVSRWARTTDEGLRGIKELRAAGAVYGASRERIDDTPEGDLALTIWLALAEMQSKKIGQTWQAVHEGRIERGLAHGQLPIGYTRIEVEDTKVVVIDEGKRHGVVEVFERYARGDTIKSVASRMSEVAGKFWPTQNTKRALRNEFYIGNIRWRGEFKPGAHDPLIGDELWARVQRRLADEAGQPPAYAEPRSPLSGLMICGGCGQRAVLVNRNRDYGPSVSCKQMRMRKEQDRTCKTNGFGTPRLSEVEEWFLMYLEDMTTEEDFVRAPEVTTKDHAQDRVEGLERDLARSRAGRDRLALAFARGAMSEEAFDSAMKQLEADIGGVENALVDARRDVVLAPADEAARQAQIMQARNLFTTLPPGEARQHLRGLLEAVVIHRVQAGRGIELIWRV